VHTVWVALPSERVRVHHIGHVGVGERALEHGLAVDPELSNSAPRVCE
jgi:hypothetical protein